MPKAPKFTMFDHDVQSANVLRHPGVSTTLAPDHAGGGWLIISSTVVLVCERIIRVRPAKVINPLLNWAAVMALDSVTVVPTIEEIVRVTCSAAMFFVQFLSPNCHAQVFSAGMPRGNSKNDRRPATLISAKADEPFLFPVHWETRP